MILFEIDLRDRCSEILDKIHTTENREYSDILILY